MRATNKLCKYYVGRGDTKPPAIDNKSETEAMEEELALLESIPIPDAGESDGDDGFFSATSEFS